MKKRKFGIVLGLLLAIFILTGCGKKSNIEVTNSRNIWYMYRGNGHGNVISMQFFKKQGKTVVVKDLDNVGDTVGSNRLGSDYGNPTYSINDDGKTITINTADKKMIFSLGDKYQQKLNGRTMVGYKATYQGKQYKFAQIQSTDKKQSDENKKKRKKNKTTSAKSQLSLRNHLMDHAVDNSKGAKDLNNNEIVGNWGYRTMVGKSRAYGTLTINKDGTYTNMLSIRAVQSKKANTDNPYVSIIQLQNGQVNSMYGKYYLKPMNLVNIRFHVHGQSEDFVIPNQVKLQVNSAINLSRIRIEKNNDKLTLYSNDLTPWSNDENATGSEMARINTKQDSMQNQYKTIIKNYDKLKKKKISSNEHLMAVVGAISDRQDNKISGIGVDFGGKYGVSQKPSDYQGVAKDGSKQHLMDYVFLVQPASLQNDKGKHSVTTGDGEMLIFGSLNNKLYILQQPDQDSSTTTWVRLKDTPLVIPDIQVSFNK